jgi:putative transposase
MVSLILPEASTAMMNGFLEEVSRVFSAYFIVMQVDGAGWHRANDLVVPENIRLISQPACSPELNPVEHIWDELREKHFHNRCFPSLKYVTEVLCQGLTALADDVERLRSLTNFPHLNVRRQVSKWYYNDYNRLLLRVTITPRIPLISRITPTAMSTMARVG